MKVFVAGPTGALGRPLVRALVAADHQVTGTTRSPGWLGEIENAGATGVPCDALDRNAVHAAVAAAGPDVVVHQLTALPRKFSKLRKGSEPTNRLRADGTRNLVDACAASGVRRLIAERIAFLYPPSGPALADESVPAWTGASEPYRSVLAALASLERSVTGTPAVEGVVLRYGTLYGPGTWYAADGDLTTRIRRRMMPVIGSGNGLTSLGHVQDAATATVRALDHGKPDVYNIVDDEPVTFAEVLPALADLRREASAAHTDLVGAPASRTSRDRSAHPPARRNERQGQGRTWLAAAVPDLAAGIRRGIRCWRPAGLEREVVLRAPVRRERGGLAGNSVVQRVKLACAVGGRRPEHGLSRCVARVDHQPHLWSDDGERHPLLRRIGEPLDVGEFGVQCGRGRQHLGEHRTRLRLEHPRIGRGGEQPPGRPHLVR